MHIIYVILQSCDNDQTNLIIGKVSLPYPQPHPPAITPCLLTVHVRLIKLAAWEQIGNSMISWLITLT